MIMMFSMTLMVFANICEQNSVSPTGEIKVLMQIMLDINLSLP